MNLIVFIAYLYIHILQIIDIICCNVNITLHFARAYMSILVLFYSAYGNRSSQQLHWHFAEAVKDNVNTRIFGMLVQIYGNSITTYSNKSAYLFILTVGRK